MLASRKSTIGLIILFFTSAAWAEGIPPAEWTPQEQQMVLQMREVYEKRGLPFTDEQASVAVKSMRDKIARMTGQVAAWQATPGLMPAPGTAATTGVQQIPSQPNAAVTEAEVGARYAEIPPKSGDVQIEGRRDGFAVNGRAFVDPEGQITNYAFDVVSGNIGYVVKAAAGDIIKVTRAGSAVEPLKIASASETIAGWQVVTSTGKTIAGSGYSVTPNGVLVSRPAAAFLYQPGQDLTSFAVPQGYLLAAFQRGDVASTGYVLLERDNSAPASGGVQGLLNSFKQLASPFGGGQEQDYALINVSTGQLYPLDIPASAKKVTAASGCQRQNALINKCSTATRFESLYDQNGRPNMGHYYWRVVWVNTPTAPLAISLEGTLTSINITDLNTGKKVTAFNRALGIAGFDVKQSGDGTVGISARLGFSNEEIDDAVAFLQSHTGVQTPEQK